MRTPTVYEALKSARDMLLAIQAGNPASEVINEAKLRAFDEAIAEHDRARMLAERNRLQIRELKSRKGFQP